MEWTPFVGLTALDEDDPITIDGASFLIKNPRITDQFLRVGAVSHRHDEHPVLPDPTRAMVGTVDPAGGTLPSDATFAITYTLLDEHGGETKAAPPVVLLTGAGLAPPSIAPSGAVDYTQGIMPAGTYFYALTYTDGVGGETTIGPTSIFTIDPGQASAAVQLAGLADELGGLAADWRLWRSYEGAEWHLTSQSSADTFLDAGFDPPDNPARPPSQGTTAALSRLNVTLPTVDEEPALARATAIRIYLAPDASFASPCFYGARDPSAAGSTLVITADSVTTGSPPHVSQSIPGAGKINSETDMMEPWVWHTPVASAGMLPSDGNNDGDVRECLDTHTLYIWSAARGWDPIPWKGTVATFTALPTAANADGDVRVVLDSRKIFAWNAILSAWQEVGGGASNPVVTPTLVRIWESVAREAFPSGTMADFTDASGGASMQIGAGGGGISAPMPRVGDTLPDLLTTTDSSQTDAVGPGVQMLRGPHSLAQYLAPVGFINAYQNGTPVAIDGSTHRPSLDTTVGGGETTMQAAWAAAGWVPAGWDWVANADTPPPSEPVPTFVQTTFGGGSGEVTGNGVGDTLTVTLPGLVTSWATSFYWDGARWAPLRVNPGDSTGYSPTNDWVPVQLYRDPPLHPDIYSYKWTEPGAVVDGNKLRVHVHGFAAMSDALGFGPSGGHIGPLNAAVGVVLNMVDDDNGIVFYVYNGGPLAMGFTTKPSDMLLCRDHFPPDDLSASQFDGSTEEVQTFGAVTFGRNPAYDPAVDGNNSWVFTEDDFWLEVWRDGDIVNGMVYQRDPALGGQGGLLCTWDVSGTAFAGVEGDSFGVAFSYLGTQHVGAEQLDVLNLSTDYPYTFRLRDADALVVLNAPGAVTATIPLHAEVPFEVGTRLDMLQAGAGQVTTAVASGGVLNSPGSDASAAQWAKISAQQYAIDAWVIDGRLA